MEAWLPSNTIQSQCRYEAVVNINYRVPLFFSMEDMGWFRTTVLRFTGIFAGLW